MRILRTTCRQRHRGALRLAPGTVARVWLASLVMLSTSLPAADWPRFLGPQRDGTCTEEGLAAKWPAGGPKALWKRDVGEGFSTPVVVGGRLVLFHREGDDDVVECLEAGSAKERWEFRYPARYRDDYGMGNGPRATPTVSNARVYTFGAQGMLHCLDLADGTKRWAVDTHEEFDVHKGFFGAAGSPLVDEDRVLLNVGGRDGAGIVALDAKTGKLLWKATDHEAGYASPVLATLGGRRHALFFTRRGLVGLDPETGKVHFDFYWRARINASVNAATPLVLGERVFISSSYRVGAALLEIEGSEVRPVWKSDESLTNHYATSVHRDGFLYGFHGRQEYGPELRCIEVATGKVRWKTDRGPAGSLLLLGDRLLIIFEDGEMVLARATPEEYAPISTARPLSPTTRAYAAVSDGRLFARDETQLVCLDLRSEAGSPEARVPTPQKEKRVSDR